MMEIDSEAIFIILPFKHPLFKKLINTLNIDFKITQQKANLFIYFSKNDSTWHFSNQLIFVDKNNNLIGFLRSAAYSPKFKKVVGIAMIYKKYCEENQDFKIIHNNESSEGKICNLPII